jgi:hypothetical protein
MNKHSSMDRFPLRNITHVGRFTILLSIGILLVSSLSLSSIAAQDQVDKPDMLSYVNDEDDLMLYDPRDRTETKLLENVQSFVLARDGRVAFTRQDENDTDLYLFDPANPSLEPVNISHNLAVHHYPVAWSPDGRYLAFVSFSPSPDFPYDIWIYQGRYLASGSDQSLYVWDGETATNIMPDNPLAPADSFYVDWSHDGRLAFTIQYGWSDADTPSEIYLWDESTTTNLSQNPDGWDGGVSWNRGGQLLFALQREVNGGIYVWDGVTFKDGLPDIDSFMRLAPELEPNYATWTDDGLIGFTSDPSSSATKKIILWDMEQEAIVRQFPVSSEYASSALSDDGQVILSSQLASGLPSVYLDVENTEGEIVFSTHTGQYDWSSDGYLAYCVYDENRNWVLTLWNEEETWAVAQVSYRPVQWQNGRDTFSCNSG